MNYGAYPSSGGWGKGASAPVAAVGGVYGPGPGAYGKGAGAYGKGAGAYGTGAGMYGKGVGAYAKAPGAYGKGVGAYAKAPGAYGKGAGTYGKGRMPGYGGAYWAPTQGGGYSKQYPPGQAGIPYGYYPGYGLVQ